MIKMNTAKSIMICKPSCLEEVEELTKDYSTMPECEDNMKLEVVVTKKLSNVIYDKITSDFFEDIEKTSNGKISFKNFKGGMIGEGADKMWLVLRITSENRPALLINPEGHNYCRYVGIEITGDL
jgi:hypothetical protein